eukprot:XP_001698594.1 predicted protein [Chlamydomonas reinhardtii]
MANRNVFCRQAQVQRARALGLGHWVRALWRPSDQQMPRAFREIRVTLGQSGDIRAPSGPARPSGVWKGMVACEVVRLRNL